MLRAEYDGHPGGRMHDAAAAFYALALVSSGDAVAAASIALKALAPPSAPVHAIRGRRTRTSSSRGGTDRRFSAHGEHGRVALGAPVDSIRRPRNQEY